MLRGYLLAAGGVLLLSLDSLVLRLIDAEPLTLSCWRGLGVAIVTYGWCRIVEKRTLRQFIRSSPPAMWLFAILQPVATIAFVYAIHATDVANVLTIIAALPLVTAVFAWLYLKERLRKATWIAIVFASLGVGLVYVSGVNAGGVTAMLATSVCVLSYAVCFTILRKHRDKSMIPALAIGGLLQVLVLLPFYQPGAIAGAASWFWVLVMAFIISCIPFIMISSAPRYISAAETSLMLLIETVLGPLWVWLILSETPAKLALLGGAIVISAVAFNAAALLLRSGTVRQA